MVDVFSAFPNAVIRNVWQLGKSARSTETGVSFESMGYKDVIVDESASGVISESPSANTIDTELLLYAKPYQVPTLNAAAYISDYLWYDSQDVQFYSIIDVGIATNQENGEVEHIEFRLRPVEVLSNGE